MNVLVDTCVWSLALRRQQPSSEHLLNLTDLVHENRVKIFGPIRQEILSGIQDEKHFNNLKERLSAFPDIPIETIDYEQGARFCNLLRKNGIQGSSVDYLICAIALRHHLSIYTVDNDFKRYQKHIDIKLFF